LIHNWSVSDEIGRVLDVLAETADGVTVDTGEGVTEYRRGGTLFAASDEADAIELRLLPDVAEAARRTPDTHASARGEEWVRFAPSVWDSQARDRLEAWFRVAWRFAGEGQK
jgi:hypothetical protein